LRLTKTSLIVTRINKKLTSHLQQQATSVAPKRTYNYSSLPGNFPFSVGSVRRVHAYRLSRPTWCINNVLC